MTNFDKFYKLENIPNNWSKTKLKYICSISKETSTNVSLENLLSLTQKGITKRNTDKNSGQFAESYENYTLIKKNQICLNPMDLLSGWVDISNFDGFISPAYYTLIISKDINVEFLNYFLQSNYYRKSFFKKGKGVASHDNYGRWVLSPTDFNNTTIFIPNNIKDQINICNYLNKKKKKIELLKNDIDKNIILRKKYFKLLINNLTTKGIDEKKNLKNFKISRWNENFPKHWKKIKLKYVVDYFKGFAFKSNLMQFHGIPIVKASDIKKFTIKKNNNFISKDYKNLYSNVKLLHKDIIISTVGSHYEVKKSAVGQFGILPKELEGSFLNQNTISLRIKDDIDVLPEYLFYCLQGKLFRSHLDYYSHGTANQSSLDVDDILNFNTLIPDLTEQKKILNYITLMKDSFDRMEELSLRQVDLLSKYYKGLVTRIIAGEVKFCKDLECH